MTKEDRLIVLLGYAYCGLQMSSRAKLLFDHFVPGDLEKTVSAVNSIRGEQWDIPAKVKKLYYLDTPGQVRRVCIKLAKSTLMIANALGLYPDTLYDIPKDLPIDLCPTELAGFFRMVIDDAIIMIQNEALRCGNDYGDICFIANPLEVNDDKNNTGNNNIKRKIGGEDESNNSIKRQGFRR